MPVLYRWLGRARKASNEHEADAYTPYQELYRIAFNAARARLDSQRETLDGVRDRAATLVAASTLVTGFLGGAALTDQSGIGSPGWAAITLFVLGLIGPLDAIRPRNGWKFDSTGRAVVASYINKQPTASVAETYYGLAVEMDEAYDSNEPALGRLFDSIEGSIIFIGFMVLAWITEIVT